MKLKRRQLKFLLFVFLLSQIAFYSFAPLYAIFATNLGLDLKSISFIWSGYSLLTAIFILLMGKLENSQKKGRMIVLGFSLFTLSSIVLAIADSKELLMIALSVNALAGGITFPAYKTMFAKSETKGKESEQWAWLDAGNMLSSAVGAGIGGLIVVSYSFQGLFMCMAAMQLLAAVVAHRTLAATDS